MTDAELLLNSDISWLAELCVLRCCTSLMFCFIGHIVNFLILIMSLFSSFQQRFCQQQASRYSPWSPFILFFCDFLLLSFPHVFLCSIPHQSCISLISPALSPSLLVCFLHSSSSPVFLRLDPPAHHSLVSCSEWCEALVQTLSATWQKSV